MVRRNVIASGLLLALGIGVASLWKLPHGAAKAGTRPNDVDTKELEELRASVSSLRKHVAVLDQRELQHRMALSFADAGPNGADEPAKAPPSSTTPQTPVETEMVAQLDDAFAEQEVDLAWSPRAAAEASRVLSGHLPARSTLKSVECKKDMCRVESRHTTVEEYQEFLKSSFMNHDSGLWNGGFSSWIVQQTATGVVAISHIAKEGHDLPNTVIEETGS